MADRGSDLGASIDLQAQQRDDISATRTLYSPLDASKREIRLLRLDIDRDDGFFHGELEAFSLDDLPPFKALSYCWGQALANRVVWINEQPFYVRPNLYAYLEIMRKERHAEWIFIEAICINQLDVTERSQQVALMGSVYRDAKLVVAWLGEDMVVAEARFENVRRICDGEHEDAPPPGDSHWIFLGMFLDNDYWTRLWIVQEIALARDLTFRRAKLKVHAERLFHILATGVRVGGLNYMAENSFHDFRQGFEGDLVRTVVAAHALLRQKHDEWAAGVQPRVLSLFKILGSYSGQLCSIDRDRIYGLLALTNSVCKVDYSAPKITVLSPDTGRGSA